MAQPKQSKEAYFFVHPECLYLLSGLVVIFIGFVYFEFKAKRLNEQQISPSYLNSNTLKITVLRIFLMFVAFTGLILALAKPILGMEKVRGFGSTKELVICIDVSNSMNCQDIEETSRLNIAKRTVNALLEKVKGDKVALCIFAGDAMPQVTLSSDLQNLRVILEDLNSDYLSNQGTNVIEALETSVKMFSKTEPSRAILLITDGENHNAPQSEVFEFIKQNNINTCILGIGTKKGGPIPVNSNHIELGYKKQENGQNVISQLNLNFIQDLANKCSGVAITSDQSYPDIDAILTEINQQKKNNSRNLNFQAKHSIYYYFVFLSFMAFIVWVFIHQPRLNE